MNKQRKISRILIANRVEIACRVIKTCRRLGIETVAVFSDADQDALHVKLADTAVHIGGSEVQSSYLNMDKIIEAAKRTGADAIHPGYGFLSENAVFARKVEAAGIIFIGPNADAIEKMGSKALAKAIAEEHDVPIVPGYRGKDQSQEKLKSEGLKIGFPLLIKASAGGGGKGMRIVEDEKELEQSILSAQREAKSAFGDDELLLEKYLPSSRHIEIQVFGDKKGNVVHLQERECTIQRRYQKIFEESPSPVLSEESRQKMADAAVRMAKALNYDNAGTVEFIYENSNFYFLEVNTRLQVEHPVTEMITGIDLVEWQILAAQGEPLPLQQQDIKATGYALECRLYAEDASKDFMPVTGKIIKWGIPETEGIRVDAGIESGVEISVFYDPMLAKIIAYGPNRNSAIIRMQYALKNIICLGTVTNLPFLQHIVNNEKFIQGNYDTHFISNHIQVSDFTEVAEDKIRLAVVAASIHRVREVMEQKTLLRDLPFAWRNNKYQDAFFDFISGEKSYRSEVVTADDGYEISIDDSRYSVSEVDDHSLLINGVLYRFDIGVSGRFFYVFHRDFGQIVVEKVDRFPEVTTDDAVGSYLSTIPASVVKVLVKSGDKVSNGDNLLVLSSMKMENTIVANSDGIIEEVYVNEGENIEAGRVLLKVEGADK